MSEESESRKDKHTFSDAVEVISVSAVPAAAVLAFVTQPLLHLADPQFLFYSGIWLAGSIAMLATARLMPPDRPRRWIFWVYMLIPLGALVFLSAGALEKAAWNDARCSYIQRAMLHPEPSTRDNLPEVFQALGCQPQGRAPVYVREGTAAWNAALAAEIILVDPKTKTAEINSQPRPDP